MADALGAFLSMVGLFGGISLLVWTSTKAKIARITAERGMSQTGAAPNAAVLAELQASKQQMAEMHETGHGFDLSFDEALTRLEGRVGRLETKTETKTAVSPAPTAETPATLRNGVNQ